MKHVLKAFCRATRLGANFTLGGMMFQRAGAMVEKNNLLSPLELLCRWNLSMPLLPDLMGQVDAIGKRRSLIGL